MNHFLAIFIVLAAFSTAAYSSDYDIIKKHAAQGDAAAQFDLATMYDVGEGVVRNLKEAAKWYHQAAEQGEVAAQYNLAIMYDTGEGVEKNIVHAYAWMATAEMFGYQGAKESSKDFLKRMTSAQQHEGELLVMTLVNRITKRNQQFPDTK